MTSNQMRLNPSCHPNPLRRGTAASSPPDRLAARRLRRTVGFVPVLLSVLLCAVPALGQPAFVQVGAFRDDVHALQMVDAMAAFGFAAGIERSGELRRVVIGPFDDKDRALEAQGQLLSRGVEGFVRLGELNLSEPSRPDASAQPQPTGAQPAATQPTAAQTTAAEADSSAPARPAGGFADLESYFFLQVGAYGPTDLAQQMVKRLDDAGYAAISVPGPDWNRVIVGPFRTKEQALAESAGLEEKGFDSFLRFGAPPLSRGASTNPLADISRSSAPTPAPERFRLRAETPLPPDVPRLSPDGAPEIEHGGAWPRYAPPAGAVELPRSIPAPPQTDTTLAAAAPPIVRSPAPLDAPSRRLRIEVLEGSGATNDIARRSGHAPAVSVLGVDGSPLADATVTYQLPERGPGGVFANGARSVTMMTREDGVAKAVGFEPNDMTGQFEIRVTASHEGAQATERIVQTNIRKAGRPRTAVKILGSVGVGVALWSLVRSLQSGDPQPPGPAPGVVGTASIGQPTAVEP